MDIKNGLVRGFLKVVGGLWATRIETLELKAERIEGKEINGIRSAISGLQTMAAQINRQSLNECTPAINDTQTFDSIKSFWQWVEPYMCRNQAYSCIVRFKATGSWTPMNGQWCKAWVSCQNKVANGAYSVAGSMILISSSDNKVYIGNVSGGISGYADLSVTWDYYYTEKDVVNRIGALFGQYGTLNVSSQHSTPSSLEGGQINLCGMGGNTGDTISLDGYNNHFRIVSNFGSNTLTVYEFTKDGIYKNGVKICG